MILKTWSLPFRAPLPRLVGTFIISGLDRTILETLFSILNVEGFLLCPSCGLSWVGPALGPAEMCTFVPAPGSRSAKMLIPDGGSLRLRINIWWAVGARPAASHWA